MEILILFLYGAITVSSVIFLTYLTGFIGENFIFNRKKRWIIKPGNLLDVGLEGLIPILLGLFIFFIIGLGIYNIFQN